MSEKLRNENMGESQRESIQKDVQSPSVSSFDQKKEFFEHVLQEDVPKEEIKTEQKKDIIEDLQTIGQDQKGRSFEEKKEFFENIGEDKEDQKVDEKIGETPKVSESKEKVSPTQEWRNKYEGESQSPLGESSDIKGKERTSQSQVLGSQQQGKESPQNWESQKGSSFGNDRTSQSQDLSSQQQVSSFGSESSQKDTSFGSGIPSVGKGSSFQSQDFQQQGKESPQNWESQKGSSFGKTSQPQDLSSQQQGSSFGSESSQKDTSFGSGIPSVGKGSSSQSQDFQQQGKESPQNWESQKGSSFGNDRTSQSQDLSSQQQGSSFGSESSQKDTSFGSGIPSVGKGNSSQSQDLQQQGKESPQNWESQKGSSFGNDRTSQPQNWESQTVNVSSPKSGDFGNQKGNESLLGYESLSSQKDTSFGSEVPSVGKGSSFQSQDFQQQGKESPQNWESQKGRSETSQKDISSGSGVPSVGSSIGKESSLQSQDLSTKGKEGFESFFPKESSTQQGDLISFEQQNEWEKQKSSDLSNQSQKGQESTLGSVSSTLPQETKGTSVSEKDENLKSRRKKGFEPKDQSQQTSKNVSKESEIEKK